MRCYMRLLRTIIDALTIAALELNVYIPHLTDAYGTPQKYVYALHILHSPLNVDSWILAEA